jgi:hypothetical protein
VRLPKPKPHSFLSIFSFILTLPMCPPAVPW